MTDGAQNTQKRSFAVKRPWYGIVINVKIDAEIDIMYMYMAF